MNIRKTLASIALAGALLAAPSLAEGAPYRIPADITVEHKRPIDLALDDVIKSMPMFIYIAAPSGPSRPILISSNGGNCTGTTTRTVSVTPPVGTTLAVAFIGSRHAAASSTCTAQTFNSVAMTAAEPWTQNTSRTGSGIYYVLNPATGSAVNVSFTFSANPSNAFIWVWFFTGNVYIPIGQVGQNSSSSANTLAATFDPDTSLPYIVAGASHAHSSGSGTGTWSGTNLSIDGSGGVAGNNSYGAGSNGSLTDPGSTAFTLTNSWSASYFSISCVEVRAVDEADLTVPWWSDYLGTRVGNSGDLTTYTLNNVPLGQPHPNRKVVCVVWARAAAASRTISSATINGETASVVVSSNASVTGQRSTFVIIAAVPTGVSGTVSITFSAAMLDCDVISYALYNYSSTPRDSVTSTGGSLADLDVAAGDVVIAAAHGNSNGSVMAGAWNGTSTEAEDIDEENDGETSQVWAGSFLSTETLSTGDWSITGGGTVTSGLCVSFPQA